MMDTTFLIMVLVIGFLAVWVTATKRGYRIGFVRGVQAAEERSEVNKHNRMIEEIDNV